jgi:hypothetical protein
VIDLLRVISDGSGTGMGTGSEAGIGSEIVFFLVFLETFFVCECYNYQF